MANRSKIIRIVLTAVTILGAAIALFVGKMATDSDFRKSTFAGVCNMLANSATPEFKALKCEFLSSVSGKVLEIGPGTGINFGCFRNNSKISEWIGIEPNEHMDAYLKSAAANYSIAFPVTLVHNTAEAMPDVASDSIDTVVSTHVLCSVADIDKVWCCCAFNSSRPDWCADYCGDLSRAQSRWPLLLLGTCCRIRRDNLALGAGRLLLLSEHNPL